jgi:F-type H+-transporting ATPase subunit b
LGEVHAIMEWLLQRGEFFTQLIAFVIFFWVMKKFAWPPLMAVLDERQKKIEDGFAQIERKQAEADKLQQDYAERLKGIELEARQKIQEAVADGRRLAAELTETAHQEAQKIAERAQENIKIEMTRARAELREEIVTMTLSASERLMREKLDDAGQRRQVEQFLQDLEAGN